MRLDASWGDACILNISSHGLLMQAAAPPARGTYVELRRGRHPMVARVVWVKHHRFGVRTQDLLPVEAIINEPESCDDELQRPTANETVYKRRSSPRDRQVQHDDSRMQSRMMEFVCIAVFVASAAGLVFGALDQAFASPLSDVSAALTPRSVGR